MGRDHHGVCAEEHDPSVGLLHGFCAICGVPWPCESELQLQAARLIAIRDEKEVERLRRLEAAVLAWDDEATGDHPLRLSAVDGRFESAIAEARAARAKGGGHG